MEIYVFRTGVTSREHVEKLTPRLNSVSGLHRWNFDLDDRENILRVETINVSPRRIEEILNKADYFCEELED